MEKILGVPPNFFEQIKTRKKTIEGRAPEGPHGVPYDDWEVGRRVTVMSESQPPEFLTVRVTSLQHFQTVEEMIQRVECKKLLPDCKTLEDIVDTYNAMPLDYRERIKKFGIYAIGIKPIED